MASSQVVYKNKRWYREDGDRLTLIVPRGHVKHFPLFGRTEDRGRRYECAQDGCHLCRSYIEDECIQAQQQWEKIGRDNALVVAAWRAERARELLLSTLGRYFDDELDNTLADEKDRC